MVLLLVNYYQSLGCGGGQTEYFLPTYLPAQPINTGGGCLLCLVCYVKKSVLFVLKHNTLLHLSKYVH